MENIDCVGLNMEYFFDEILIEVFGHLSLNMLKNCRMVCKRWDELISRDKNLLKNSHMVFRTPRDFERLSHIRRMPKDVFILDDKTFTPNVFKHFHDLHSLKIDLRPCYSYLEPFDFKRLLRLVPNLKVFHISDVSFDDYIHNLDVLCKSRINLDELQCNSELLYVFTCSTLKVLNLRWHCNLSAKSKLNACEFVSFQKDLESFTLNHSNEFFDQFSNFKHEFHLKSFTFISNSNFQDFQSFIQFLEPHKLTLKSLKIEMFSFEQSKFAIEEILKYIMKNLPNLEELEIETIFRGINRKMEFIELQLSNRAANTIERLGFSDIFHADEDYKQIIDMLPRMEQLSIKASSHKVLAILEHAATKSQVESLKVFNFDCVLSAVKFPNLKEFSVHTFSTRIRDFCSFISCNSKTLERINIGDASNLCLQTVTAITKCENLRYLTIDVSGNYLASIMSILRGVLLHSKPLTITFKDYPSVMRFDLPGDQIFWEERIRLCKMVKAFHKSDTDVFRKFQGFT